MQAESSIDMYSEHGFDAVIGPVFGSVCHLLIVVSYWTPGSAHCHAASAIGPYEEYPKNREPHNQVMRMHQAAAYEIENDLVEEPLLHAARESWDEAVALGEQHGYRNAQATVLAPTGTISFLMDCDTTGVEPDFSLVKF